MCFKRCLRLIWYHFYTLVDQTHNFIKFGIKYRYVTVQTSRTGIYTGTVFRTGTHP